MTPTALDIVTARRFGPLTAVVVATLGLSGCNGCSEDKPYTPFGVASDSSASGGASSAPSASDSAAAPKRFASRASETAPKGAKKWQLAGVEISAPAGTQFERGLAADFDLDSKLDRVAWVTPVKRELGSVPALWYFPSGGKAKLLTKLPSYVPAGTDCKYRTALIQTGKQTVTLDVTADCRSKYVERSPARSVVVLAPAAGRTVAELRVALPAAGERIDVDVSSDDRDGDGRDDVLAGITVTAGGVGARADIGYYDRPAGLSRDNTLPRASFARVANAALASARAKSSAAKVPAKVEALRRLWTSLCRESQSARVFDETGVALSCVAGDALQRATVAEVRSLAKAADVLGAHGARSRANWFGAPLSAANKQALAKELGRLVTERSVTKTVVKGSPVQGAGTPRYSPLAFETDGALLLQEPRAILRIGKQGDATDVSDEIERWDLTITDDGGQRWTGIGFPCNKPYVTLGIDTQTGAHADAIETKLLAPRPASCETHGGIVPRLTPLRWSAAGLDVLVDGYRTLTERGTLDGGPAPLGSALSQDGKRLAIRFEDGLLVLGGAKPELWRPLPSNASECVVSAIGDRAACVVGTGAALFAPKS